MNDRDTIAAEAAAAVGLTTGQVAALDTLLTGGATVPFVARYRKEQTGGLDETQIRAVRDALAGIREREQRRAYVLRQIRAQGQLTAALERQITKASLLSEIDDLYLPYRKKRTTRAHRATEAGLEPLAHDVYAQAGRGWRSRVAEYRCETYPEEEDVLAGCRDIIAGWIAQDAETRRALRSLFTREARLETKKRSTIDRFADFYGFSQSVGKIAGHRVLGALRAAAEGAVRLTARPPEERAVALLETLHFRGEPEVRSAIADSYRRLLCPSLEGEMTTQLKRQADNDAIAVFTTNLRELLLEAPLGEHAVLAIDPGFRTGCKCAALDATGTLLEHGVIYPVEPHNRAEEAANTVRSLLERHQITVIAVGNGTAGRETERFLRSLELEQVMIVPVDESGASVYSASEQAGLEFPDLDLTVRGAISIGRRLQDPLAELVKIDPQSIGVGQYQHDVDQKLLASALGETVEECVNRVGVNLNQASEPLLRFVSGLSAANARAIVSARRKRPFRCRAELQNVSGIGEKTFEQAAGFLRVHGGTEPLDATAVHPERYEVARFLQAADDIASVDLSRFATKEVGLPTLADIREELLRPGRDPRETFVPPEFREDVTSMDDLADGMVLSGIVTNVTRVGAFVDIGVHQDGLVHVSEIADRYVADPAEELRVRRHVRVKVISVDTERKRIGLSIRQV